MVDLNILIAFSGGILSFFAPCVVPLIPVYIGYVTGVSLKDLKEKGYFPYLKQMLFSSLVYVLGFSIIFVILGMAAGGVGMLFRAYSGLLQKIGGFVMIILGLEFSGILNIPFLAKQRQLTLPSWMDRLGYLRAFFIGVVFATAWTPCVGALLGSILALATVSGTATYGALLLFVYSLGISVPFLLVSLTLAWIPYYLNFVTKYINIISFFGGVILALIGLLLLTDTFKYLNQWIFEIAFRLGFTVR